MNRILLTLSVAVLMTASAFAQPGKDAVKKVEASFEPAEAKPGQTVTLKVTITLADGYHTYPCTQPDPEAKFSSNKISFPTEGSLIYVGDTIDPVGPKTKKEADMSLDYYPGGGTWIRKVVVSPEAKPGTANSKVKVRLLVCDQDNCFPPKSIDLEANLKVLDAPALPLDPLYKKEVEKALKK